MRSHRLTINKNRRHTWCIKTCKQSVYHNYQIQLFSSALKSGIFSGKTFIQIAIIALYLGHFIFRSKHPIVIIQRFLHFFLIYMGAFFIFSNRVGDGKFRKIRKHLSDFLINHKRSFSVLYPGKQLIIFLCNLNGFGCKHALICHSLSVLKA